MVYIVGWIKVDNRNGKVVEMDQQPFKDKNEANRFAGRLRYQKKKEQDRYYMHIRVYEDDRVKENKDG